MTARKTKGDLAELKVAADLVARGYRIALPYGEDNDFDLILCRSNRLERVQVKYTESNGVIITVRCQTCSLTNGRVKRRKSYTAATVDWIAVYDLTTDCCYYLPSSELGDGHSHLSLRLTPAKNGQRAKIRFAERYLDPLVRA